ncbi:uncharacterized protein LOC143426399 [Xylocopa sonorina]|uniref:uncharacterized protein LOC143426399 n=1 Tax=Xylocopa sonorina TaxID=1818115 RepID=UPI00403ACD3C
MDYDQYYCKKDNAYLIHFPNHKGLSLIEIDKIFSAYGKVLSIDNRGKSHGLCFVRYEKLGDVRRCINALQNHSFIKILRHKLKVNATSETKKLKEPYKSKNGSTCQDIYCNDSNDIEIDCLSDTNSINLPITINVQKSTTKRIPSLINRFKDKNLENAASSTLISSNLDNTNSHRFEEMFDDTGIPSLVCTDQQNKTYNYKTSTPTTKSIQAQQVIVANIHPNLSIHYILHLFEKYNPISVSLMMTIPKSGIRYCHVYYKTYEEAYATMKEFDKHYLEGKSLIVLTSQKLMEEAF